MSKFTAAQLEEHYGYRARGYKAEYNSGAWFDTDGGPDFNSNTENWRIKPAKKIIDMSHLIKSGIDCEFSDDAKVWGISQLDDVVHGGAFLDTRWIPWEHCRPRMNHKMFHDGGDCPLPEGFKVMPIYRDPALSVLPVHASEEIWVSCNLPYEVIGYEILGLADGWAYPWENNQ